MMIIAIAFKCPANAAANVSNEDGIMTPEQIIRRIAEIAHAVGWQANVGAMEMAGQFVSYLAEHPEHVEAFLRDGSGFVIENGLPVGQGCLTFHRRLDGKVTTPQELRVAIDVKKMERQANQ